MRDVKSLREGLERAREDALRVDEERRASTRDIHAAVEALADRARAYDRAFDENKRLHNEIQDLKGSIRVFCRVRPGVASVDERRGLAGSEASLEASALEASALSSSRPAARARLNEDGDPVRVELDVEAAEQVRKDDRLDDAAHQLVNVLQSLNYLRLLPIEVVKDQAGCHLALAYAAPRDDRLTFECVACSSERP